jgi:TetR/AcrR family transcriptional regulator
MAQAQSDDELLAPSWAERAADRSPSVMRSRIRSLQRAKQIVEAARRLVEVKGADFTTHELVKEAGIALQTFYTHFGSKDQVLLAVIEEMVTETSNDLRLRGSIVVDPVARLRLYVTGVVGTANPHGFASPGTRFVTTEHWRLQQQYPQELAAATQPVTTLLLEALQEAAAEGLLAPANPEYDAWLTAQLITAVFHHYAFAPPEASIDEIAERLWTFCFAAWGGRPS